MRETNSVMGFLFRPESYVEFTGTAAAQAQSRQNLIVHSLLAGIGLVLFLTIVMDNYRNLFLVLINLPFGLVGGVLVVFASGTEFSLGSLVGFVTIFGITRIDALRALIDAAISELQKPFLDERQIASSRTIMGLAMRLHWFARINLFI
jgi:Cu/Ag efflux pump CusA